MIRSEERSIIFDNVSKFYGEVLGVNRVSLSIEDSVDQVLSWWQQRKPF